MGLCGRIVGTFFLAYLVLIAFTVYTIMFPAQCALSDSSLCYHPLFPATDKILVRVSVDKEELWNYTTSFGSLSLEQTLSIPIDPEIRRNHVYIQNENRKQRHVLLVVEIIAIDDVTGSKHIERSHNLRIPLTVVRDRKKISGAKNLLSSESDVQYNVQESSANKSLHFKFGVHPLVIRVVPMDSVLPTPFLPAVNTQLFVKSIQAESGLQLKYAPVVWVDDISITRNQYLELSSNISQSNPKIVFKMVTTNLLHYGIKAGIKQSFEQISNYISPDDLDEFRWWLSDDRVYRFILTQVISYIHIFFEYLAFKDDWKFFSGRKTFSGISISSLLFAQLRSIIIFLYLYDSDTSYIVLISIVPALKYEERLFSKSDEERRTAEYDSFAILHMTLSLFPAIVGIAIYSLICNTYKSWYSWIISSLADSVYFFGFISMTPQLYINYKLKSVAHLPIKAFGYKIFNTFIDDVFAFLVKMPLKHRIMTLRDDIIFFGFIYQWYIYPADLTRPNEFGFQYETITEKEKLPEVIITEGMRRIGLIEVDMVLNKCFFTGMSFRNAHDILFAIRRIPNEFRQTVDKCLLKDEDFLSSALESWFTTNNKDLNAKLKVFSNKRQGCSEQVGEEEQSSFEIHDDLLALNFEAYFVDETTRDAELVMRAVKFNLFNVEHN